MLTESFLYKTRISEAELKGRKNEELSEPGVSVLACIATQTDRAAPTRSQRYEYSYNLVFCFSLLRALRSPIE